MDIINYAKNIGSVLATATTVAYFSGYLILRARANALGTDPAFTLVDEAYVFAGFRFLFVTLVVLLLLSPLLIVTNLGIAWVIRHIPSHWMNLVQWVLLAMLTIVTLMTVKVLNVSDLLLQQSVTNNNTKLMGAIMGTQPAFGLLLMFFIVFLAALSAYWLRARITTGFDAFTMVLCVVVAILLFMLPIYHGALFADRKVRLLARVPDAIKGVYEPLGIVDHTKEQYTLFGLDANGSPRLTTIKQEDLYGIPIRKVVSLKNFMEIIAESSKALESTSSIQTSGEKEMESNESDANESFFKTLINELHMAFIAIASLGGDSVVQAGQLWSVKLDASGKSSELKQLGTIDNLSWPVAGPDGATIYALQQSQVVELIDNFQTTEVIHSKANWIKLLGIAKDGSILGIVYQDNQTRPAILTKTGDLQVNPPTQSTEDQTLISYLLQEARSYVGGKSLYVDRSERGGRGFDVFLKLGDQVINLSDCGDDNCGQPSFSSDFRLVLFIRQPRY